jgi:hypothetical protein
LSFQIKFNLSLIHNNLYSKDPFGVFEATTPSLGLVGIPEQNTSMLEKSNDATKSFWLKTIGIFLLILFFGLILHFRDSLFGVFKKKVAQLNDKINPTDKPEIVEVEILPGYNEAFLIDETKRQELIIQDSKSDKIIKPILRGRDINRYTTTWDKSYLINTLPSLKININSYSSIKLILESFGKRLHQIGESFIEDGITQTTRKKHRINGLRHKMQLHFIKNSPRKSSFGSE